MTATATAKQNGRQHVQVRPFVGSLQRPWVTRWRSSVAERFPPVCLLDTVLQSRAHPALYQSDRNSATPAPHPQGPAVALRACVTSLWFAGSGQRA